MFPFTRELDHPADGEGEASPEAADRVFHDKRRCPPKADEDACLAWTAGDWRPL